jgi:hypothetical protein
MIAITIYFSLPLKQNRTFGGLNVSRLSVSPSVSLSVCLSMNKILLSATELQWEISL